MTALVTGAPGRCILVTGGSGFPGWHGAMEGLLVDVSADDFIALPEWIR